MSSKPFPASTKRLLKARREGRVSKSAILTGHIGLTIGYCLIYCSSNYLLEFFKAALNYCLSSAVDSAESFFLPIIFLALTGAGSFITIVTVVFVSVEVLQLGGKIYLGAIYQQQDGSCFTRGISKLKHALTQSWQQVLYFALGMGGLCMVIVNGTTRGSCLVVVFVLVLLGVLDWWLQRRSYLESMRMDMKELMDEHKESEGDPHLKAKRQSLQRAFANEPLEMRVKRAKVIIVDRDVSRRSGKIYSRAASAF